MAFQVSIGDILMLSNLAWQLGRAFTQGKSGAPAQFEEVERELKSLHTALTLLGESLSEDDSLLSRADARTKDGIGKIVGCCDQTLEDLQSFVEQYQEIKRPDGPRGPAQRTWRSILVRNWKTIIWTTEGGNIQHLRNLLSMHTQSISLAMQALQTGSLSRLERIIEPVAEKIDIINNKLSGDMDEKINEIHSFLHSIQNNFDQASPFLLPQGQPHHSTSFSGSNHSPRASRANLILLRSAQSSWPDSGYLASENDQSDFSDSETFVRSASTSRTTTGFQALSRRGTAKMDPLKERTPNLLGDTSPKPLEKRFSRTSSVDTDEIFSIPSKKMTNLTLGAPAISAPISPISPVKRSNSSSKWIMSPWKEDAIEEASQPNGPPSRASVVSSGRNCSVDMLSFERQLFSNALTECDISGKAVEYTIPDEEKPTDFVMEKACDDCRVCVIRRPIKMAGGANRYVTSIWALSKDGKVRLQQKIPEDRNVIPYTVWGSDTKVVLRFETEMRYHDMKTQSIDSPLVKATKTQWVTYAFSNERDATTFQNSLTSTQLLLSVKTKRTMRLHDGLSGAFTYAEQLCALENLRLFEDINTGLVTCMIHFVSQFADGYLSFPMNERGVDIRMKEDGDGRVRIKGLGISIGNLFVGGRRKSTVASSPVESEGPGKKAKESKKDRITGIVIEFSTPEDRFLFVRMVGEIRRNTVAVTQGTGPLD